MQAVEHADFFGCFVAVVADLLAGAEGALVWPLFEGEGEGGHVGVRADAGVLKGSPGAAEVVVGVDGRPVPVGEVLGDVVREVDAGEAGTDDEEVEGALGGGVCKLRQGRGGVGRCS